MYVLWPRIWGFLESNSSCSCRQSFLPTAAGSLTARTVGSAGFGESLEASRPFTARDSGFTPLSTTFTPTSPSRSPTNRSPRSPSKKTGGPRQVLRFYAYFLESVQESRIENFRVRKCVLLFYLEDGTMQITETKQNNAGIPQGNFLRRGKIAKNEEGAQCRSLAGWGYCRSDNV